MDDFKSSQAFLKSSAEDLSQTKQVLFSGWTLQSTKAFLALSLPLLQQWKHFAAKPGMNTKQYEKNKKVLQCPEKGKEDTEGSEAQV